MRAFAVIMAIAATVGLCKPALALEPITIELLTLPFGTSSYASDMALESLFKEIKSPIKLQLKQTPGAMFISRYNADNLTKMREGKVPFTMSLTMATIVPYMGKGLPPYQDYPSPDSRIALATSGALSLFVTFKEGIKSPADFKGKKVGVAERSRPNMSTLPNQPVFDYAYGGFDKVDWQYLGFSNSKDAILNGSIDVHMGNITGAIKTAPDGSLYIDSATPDPALMEVISSGNKYYIVSEDPEVLKAAYDPAKHLVQVPVLVKAGTLPGQTSDAWVKGGFTVYSVDKNLPADVVEELVYQIFTNKARLTDYYESFKYMGATPLPAGVDPHFIHPGLYRAMKRLGIPLPEGVTVP